MLDRSQTANLFSENDQDRSELVGAADATVERPPASPDAVRAPHIASRSTTLPPSGRPSRARRTGGGRRGAVSTKRRVALPKPQFSLSSVPPRLRRALAFTPLVGVLILLAHQAGCAGRVTHIQTGATSVPSGTRTPVAHHTRRPVRTHPRTRSHLATPSTTVTSARAPAPQVGSLAGTVTARQEPSVSATTPVIPTVDTPPVSPPAATSSGSLTRRENDEGDEFSFER
jgi:hypothetical protein